MDFLIYRGKLSNLVFLISLNPRDQFCYTNYLHWKLFHTNENRTGLRQLVSNFINVCILKN